MKKASLVQMVFLIYGAACGGAFGLEEMVSGSGPGMALLILAIMPFLWSIPISLACAELASSFPVEGGYYAWGRMAFGDFVGYLCGFLTWIGIFATNGTFAVLFATYLKDWLPLTPTTSFLVSLALIWGVTYCNMRGIRAVGLSSIWLSLGLLVPFVVMVVLGVIQWKTNPFAPLVPPDKAKIAAFGEGLMLAVYLYSGYDKITVSAEEVENPSRNFPLSFAIAVPMVALSYFLPTLAGLASQGDWTAWHERHFSELALSMGGPLLGAAMTFAALLSNTVLLNATMLAQSRLPMAMAKDGLFPPIFGRTHARYGTPIISLLVGGLILSALCRFSFTELVTIYSVTQMLGYLLIYATLWRLRWTHRDVTRPFRIPFGVWGLLGVTGSSVLIATMALYKTEHVMISLIAVALGPVSYVFMRLARRPVAKLMP